jgi:fused signal recognition particle receptor
VELDPQSLELVWIALGSLSLLGALGWLVFKPKRRASIGVTAPAPLSSSPSQTAIAADANASVWWNALSKTRDRFLMIGKRESVAELKEALEEACLVSDLGVGNTQELLASLDWSSLAARSPESQVTEAKKNVSLQLRGWLQSAQPSSDVWPPAPKAGEPVVIWFVGVNGVGKTTSIAKLAQELKEKGHKVLLGAGDTFRAAAGEQLETWAQRLGIECVRGAAGADASSVLFDAIQAGQSRGVDYVLCDSAGRLHNQSQLMEALTKNRRVMDKALPGAPHETLLVLDGHTGQNMLQQAEHFMKAVGLTGLILTKMDGSARGGALVAVARKTGLPIRRLGLGESAADFVAFDAHRFADALLGL